MQIAVIDTETTGMNPDEDRIVEIAAAWLDGHFASSLVNPGNKLISFGAMGVHHITDEMTDHAPNRTDAMGHCGLIKPTNEPGGLQFSPEIILAMHNAEFDRALLPEWAKSLRYICTYRCSLHLCPDADSHSNGALWHELGLAGDMPSEAGNMPHRALFDALMTRDILGWMRDRAAETLGLTPEDAEYQAGAPIEHLIQLTSEPVLLKKCRFGKHRDTEWRDVPTDYMYWVLRQDFDADTKHTCKHWIERREAEHAPI